MATEKSFFGRDGSTKKKTNPWAPKPPGAAPAAPAAPAVPKPPAPKPPKATPNNPFLTREWRLGQMDPGPQRVAYRRDLVGDRRNWNQNQAQQEAQRRRDTFQDDLWNNNNAYNPFANPADMPNSPYANPGYDASHGYGKAVDQYLQTGVGREWIKNNPQPYYGHVMSAAGHGYGDNTAYGRYVKNQYDSEYGNYQMAQSQSPGLSWTQFLLGRLPQIENEYRGRSFRSRGEIPMVSGGASWLGGF
jgi:hypothetical protein